jgi:hypothetical protein
MVDRAEAERVLVEGITVEREPGPVPSGTVSAG